MSNNKNDILILALLERQDSVKKTIVKCATSEDPRDASLIDHYIKQSSIIDDMVKEATLTPKFVE